MAIKPPIQGLNIKTADSGFYEGFSKFVTVGSKLAIGALILWAVAFPDAAGGVLKSIRSTIDANTGSWYMYVMTLYILVCLGLALWPATGRIRLGGVHSKPEFSSFFLVFHDVWGRHRYRYVNLCHG